MHAIQKYGAKSETVGNIKIDFIDGLPLKDQIIRIYQQLERHKKAEINQTVDVIGRYYSNNKRRDETDFYQANEENLENFNKYFTTDEDRSKALDLDQNLDKTGMVWKSVSFYIKAIPQFTKFETKNYSN